MASVEGPQALMTTENTTFVDINTDNLDEFNLLMSGKAMPKETQEEPTSEDKDLNALENETNDDDAIEDEDSLANEDEIEEQEPVEQEKPKKNRFQERIDELTAKAREEERKNKDLFEQLNKALEKLNAIDNKPVETPVVEAPKDGAPDSSDSTKYPLGEYDPEFIKDFTRYTIRQETEALRKEQEAERQAMEKRVQEEALTNQWNEKVNKSQEKYPDFKEKGENLKEVFLGVEQGYAEYLASTIMSMEAGPDIFYYLASNPEEATRVFASGPTRATIALGRLDAILSDDSEAKKQKQIKVTAAPTPPPSLNKGTKGSVSISPDTDDLEAFEKIYYAMPRKSGIL